MNFVSFLKHAVPTWWEIARSRRSEGRAAVLSRVWSHHSNRSGYRHISDGLGIVLPAHGMRLVPAALSRLIVGEALDEAYQVDVAMKLLGRDRLLILKESTSLD